MYDLIDDNALSEAAEICRQWDINKRHTDSAYAKTLEEATKFATGDLWLEHRQIAEEEILTKMEKAGMDVKFANGKYNYSKLNLGSNYRSCKSTISRAIDLKIPFKDEDGNLVGKSKLEKLVAKKMVGIRAAEEAVVPEGTVLADIHLAMEGLACLKTAWPVLNEAEREEIKDELRAMISKHK